MRLLTARLFVVVALVATASAQGTPDDWPQWGGSNRNFRQPATALSVAWPAAGPKQLWSRNLGGGYGGIAVVDDTLYTLVRRDGQEVALALDAGDGSLRWRESILVPDRDLDYGMGPFTTPLVAGDRLLVLGVEGDLRCLARKDGARLWIRKLHTEFPGSRAGRGYATSPLLCDGLVIVPVGAPDAGVVALDPDTGRTVWQRHDFGVDYASPIAITVGGSPQVICQMEAEIIGLRPADGELLWRVGSKSERTRHVISPLDLGSGSLLACTTYGVRRLDPEDGAVTVAWTSRRISTQVGNVLSWPEHDMVLGASSASSGAVLVALDAGTGQVLWRDRAIDCGFLWRVGDRLLGLASDGELVQARANRAGLQVLGRCTPIVNEKVWSAPAMVGRTLYLKGQERIVALDLGN